MIYRSYQHVERLGTTETNGILGGTCYIFPKIDGTNATVWLGDDNTLRAGSRKRELSLEDDNAGFCAFANRGDNYLVFLRVFPNLRLYGEWLVPHSLRTYRDDAWRHFYIFDVMEETLERRIAETYITRALVEKEKAKIELEEGGWSPRHIPRLLGQIWHCLITEEMWNILEKFKPKTLDFRELNRRANLQIKAVMPEIFQ